MIQRKKPMVPRPEDGREFTLLRREQQKLRGELDLVDGAIAADRAALDEAHSHMLQNMVPREPASEIDKRIAASHNRRDEIVKRLRAISTELPLARSKAVNAIRDDLAPGHNDAVRKFLAARLCRLAAEIEAAAPVLALRDEIDARRVGYGGLVHSDTLIATKAAFAKLKADVVQALAAGVLKDGDIPAGVRKTWDL